MIINENHPTYTTSTDVAEIAKTLKKLDILISTLHAIIKLVREFG